MNEFEIDTSDAVGGPILSVIIGIRDWEISRLRIAIRSHLDCTIGDEIEVVVSDYGSQNHSEVEELVRAMGCTYIHTDSDIWSRSRALNTGIVASRGEFLLATDADIIFAPQTHAITVDLLRKYPHSLHLKQCRDLPMSIGLEELETIDWVRLGEIAHTRPRWGMGGLAACSRETADRVRGYDERMVVWGAEDNDFGKRVRASGGIVNWITDDAAQIFHVWHPPFLQTNPDATAIFDINRGYLNNDPSVIRNLTSGAIYKGRKPMVSVVIATKNRAQYLRESIRSVLNQSFREFELIVIDDGSEDDTQEVLSSITDPRLRHVRNDISKGVGEARNIANALARAPYIAVHDDDDLMLPGRLERQLGTITAGVQGAYGGWIDFNDETGNLSHLPGKAPFNLAAICFTGSVLLHPTLLVETQIFAQFPYHAEFRAGSDYNVVFRMAWNGISLLHCGDYVTLRRIHPLNMTAVSSTVQKTSSRVTNGMLLNSIPSGIERSLRNLAEETRDLDIVMTDAVMDAVQFLLSDHLAIKVASIMPADLGTYGDTEGVVLIGQMSTAGIELREELHRLSDFSPAELDLIIAKQIFYTGSFEIFYRGNETVAEPLNNGILAGILSAGNDWIVLATKDGDTLAETLERAHLLLPLGEDIVMCRQNGCWLIAFEAGTPHRRSIIEVKTGIVEHGIDILGVQRMAS